MTAASGGSSSHVPAARDAPDNSPGSPASGSTASSGSGAPPGTAGSPGGTSPSGNLITGDLGAAIGVLADRIAAALVHREPGWRLPRRSALARRYNVGVPEIDAAIGELIRRSLIRRLPDGQLYRASQAEYLIPVEGISGLRTRLDPMGGEITCQARHVSQRDAPQDVAWALGAGDGAAPVRVVRCVWASGGEPVAISTAYVPDAVATMVSDDGMLSFAGALQALPAGTAAPEGAYAAAVDMELAPPPPSVARSLRLVPGQSAISVTIRFDDTATRAPVGLSVVILKPDRFRVVIEAS